MGSWWQILESLPDKLHSDVYLGLELQTLTYIAPWKQATYIYLSQTDLKQVSSIWKSTRNQFLSCLGVNGVGFWHCRICYKKNPNCLENWHIYCTYFHSILHTCSTNAKKKILYDNSQDMCHSFDKFVGKQIIKILEVRIECIS